MMVAFFSWLCSSFINGGSCLKSYLFEKFIKKLILKKSFKIIRIDRLYII